jgi:hypothetical protein
MSCFIFLVFQKSPYPSRHPFVRLASKFTKYFPSKQVIQNPSPFFSIPVAFTSHFMERQCREPAPDHSAFPGRAG